MSEPNNQSPFARLTRSSVHNNDVNVPNWVFLWASLKTPQIENAVVSTFFITEFTIQK